MFLNNTSTLPFNTTDNYSPQGFDTGSQTKFLVNSNSR